MLNKIAEITGFANRQNDVVVNQILQRIQAKLPKGIDENSPQFTEAVETAEKAVNAEGQLAIVSLVRQITAPEPEKVLKIKSSPKGDRIAVAAANGVRYSFGPIWNESVKKGKGIALAEANRAKLNHQGLLAGIENAEALSAQELAAQIAKTL